MSPPTHLLGSLRALPPSLTNMSQIDCGAHTQRPWSTLLSAHPNTAVWSTNSLPPTVLGCTDGTSIWLTVEQTVAEARCTLVHELIHLERGHSACQPPDVEVDVAREAAQRLIPIDELADALAHTRSELEAAEMLWVDVDTLRTRLTFLDDVERARLGLAHDLAC